MAFYESVPPDPIYGGGGGGSAMPAAGGLPGSYAALFGGQVAQPSWFENRWPNRRPPPGPGAQPPAPPPGGNQAPGRSQAPAYRTTPIGMSEVLAQRRRLLMGLPGAAGPSSAVMSSPSASGAVPQATVQPYGASGGGWGSGLGWGGKWGREGSTPGQDSSALLAALTQKLGIDSASRRAQAGTAARYFAGSDPAAAGYASLASTLGSESSDATALNDLRVAIASGDYNYAHQLLLQRMQNAAALQAAQAANPGLAGALGSLGGSVIGALFPH